jgi:hypothetical protein
MNLACPGTYLASFANAHLFAIRFVIGITFFQQSHAFWSSMSGPKLRARVVSMIY